MHEENKGDKYWALQRSLDKTYFTKSFPTRSSFQKRFAHKLIDFEENEFILKDEITIGHSYNGKRHLKALFLQDDRKIEKLIVQQFGIEGNPIKNRTKEASFRSSEVERLYFFLKSIKEVKFPSEQNLNIKDTELAKMLINSEQASKIVQDNIEIIQEALKNNISSQDLVNFGYRKSQLNIFNKLLSEDGFFQKYRDYIEETTGKDCSEEGVWQKFFERNTWILGYGLDYIFNSELESKKLEQVISGSNFFSPGKRTDALLKSAGAINSLCFCELKLSSDNLLKKVVKSYRIESWQISDSLSGAIAQVQRTIQKAIEDIATKTEIKDKQDNLTGEQLYLYSPKAFIIIGNKNEFIVDGKINETKFSSFEIFRRNLNNIEILTYDELYERAYYICNKKI